MKIVKKCLRALALLLLAGALTTLAEELTHAALHPKETR